MPVPPRQVPPVGTLERMKVLDLAKALRTAYALASACAGIPDMRRWDELDPTEESRWIAVAMAALELL